MLSGEPPVIPGLRKDPRRVQGGQRDGWYILPCPRTNLPREWQRATTLAHTLSDQHYINLWRERMVAAGISLGAELDDTLLREVVRLFEATGGSPDPKQARKAKEALNALCTEAKHRAGADDGAAWGTALHSLTEWSDAGRISEIETPIDLVADLAAYMTKMAAEQITRPRRFIERIIVNEELDTAGTFDRLVQIDGRLYVFDLKTQKTVDFGWLEIAIQLAEYARALFVWDIERETYFPMPEVDQTIALVGHLPVGKGEMTIHEVDIVEGWEAALEAKSVRGRRNRSKSMGRPWARRAPEPQRDPVLVAIEACRDREAMLEVWRTHRRAWTDEHSAWAKLHEANNFRPPAELATSDQGS